MPWRVLGGLTTRDIALMAQRQIQDHMDSCERKWRQADEKMDKVDNKLDKAQEKLDKAQDTWEKFPKNIYTALIALLLTVLGFILAETFHFSLQVGENRAAIQHLQN